MVRAYLPVSRSKQDDTSYRVTHTSCDLGEQFAASVPKPFWVKTLGWQELEGRG